MKTIQVLLEQKVLRYAWVTVDVPDVSDEKTIVKLAREKSGSVDRWIDATQVGPVNVKRVENTD